MNLIFKIPGPLLVFFGACSLSFGGLIVKSFEGATLWQILFWRSLFFIMVVFIFLLISYKKKIFRAFYNSGIPGIFGGIILSSGFCGYVFAMYNTTVANTNFIIQTQTIFLAIFGYFFLKEKISKITLVSIFLAISGIILMVGSDLEPGQMSGNLAAFIMPVSFAILILIIRKYPNVDMVPLQLYAGITAMIIGYIIAGKINISAHDIFLGFFCRIFSIRFWIYFNYHWCQINSFSDGWNYNVNRSSFRTILGMAIYQRKFIFYGFDRRYNCYNCCFASILHFN